MNGIGIKSAVRQFGHSHTHATHVSENSFKRPEGARQCTLRWRINSWLHHATAARATPPLVTSRAALLPAAALAPVGKLPDHQFITRPHSQSVMCHANRRTYYSVNATCFLRPFEGQRQKQRLHRLGPNLIRHRSNGVGALTAWQCHFIYKRSGNHINLPIYWDWCKQKEPYPK